MTIGIALAVLWIMAATGYRLAAIGASGLFAAWSLFEFSTGMRRRFGKAFEDKHTKKAIKVLKRFGFTATANQMTKVGDLDLLVEGRYRINVEIKSWRSYGDNPKFLKREKEVLKQIEAQRVAGDTHASILWLPQASNSFLQMLFSPSTKISQNIWVVRGNPRTLGKALRKIMGKKFKPVTFN
jgi:hypothetical protein